MSLYNHLGTRLDLRKLMSYPLTPIPYSIATADGFVKTNKANGMELIAKDVDYKPSPPPPPPLPKTMKLWLQKMKMQYFTICLKCQGISEELQKRFQHHGKKITFVIFSTDMYHPNSVKAVERGKAAEVIVGGENTKKPKERQSFLINDENKK